VAVAEALKFDAANCQSWILDAAKRSDRDHDAMLFGVLRTLRCMETILASALVQAAQGGA
jgi:hypothetical protein